MAEEKPKQQQPHRGGQPTLPGDNPKPPKRVVRTYQEDLARMSKNAHPEEAKKHAPKQKQKPQKKGGLVTPPKQKKKEEPKPAPQKITIDEAPASITAETKKHYVEEIRATDTMEISKADSFTKEDLEHAANLVQEKPPVEKPVPAPGRPMAKPKPLPKREPAVVIEDASAPQQNIFAGIMSWLLGGAGEPEQKEETRAKSNVAPPKTLESIPVVPKAPQKEAPAVEPKPAPTVPKPEPVAPPAPKPKVAPPLPQTPPVPTPQPPQKNPLFAAPKPKAPEPVAPVTLPRPERKPEDIQKPSPLQTYTSDARKGIEKQKATPLSVLARQQDARKAPPKRSTPKKRSSVPFILGGVALLFLGIGIVVGTYVYLQPDPQPQPATPRVVTPVFAEDRVRVSASDVPTIENIGSLLLDIPAPQGDTLSHITFANEAGALIPFSDILLNSSEVPGVLARSTFPQSMFGIFGEDKEPVMVLAVSSFERSFRSLLSWENDMPQALLSIFGTLDTEVIGTTTPAYIPVFIDEEIGTTDTRILYDAAGNPHIMYGFVDANLLFVTQSEGAFRALVERIVRE